MYWTYCLERGAPQRVNHASVAVEEKIFSFGGFCGGQDMPTLIDIYCFDTDVLQWSKVDYEINEECPFGCYGHSVVAYQHMIYLWGGQNAYGASNTLYSFDTNTSTWSQPETSGLTPRPIDGHSACVIGNFMYIFGGYEESTTHYLDKVYSLNLVTFRWQEVETYGNPPCSRDFHTASVVGSCMYIFGGRISEDIIEFYPREIMYLDTETMRWITPFSRGILPCVRRSHSAVVYKDEIYIIGGYDGIREVHLIDVHKFNPVTCVWTEMNTFGRKPFPRRRHCSVVINDIIYLFGGSSPEENTLAGGRPLLREHCDMHMLEFVPSLKTLSLLNIVESEIDYRSLPDCLRNEVSLLASLRMQPHAIFLRQMSDDSP